MELAPDFFGYFAAAAPLLDADASLLCASSWNDHGQARLVRDAARLERTDFFPGLGWMLTAALWGELRCARPGAARARPPRCPPEQQSAGRTHLCVPRLARGQAATCACSIGRHMLARAGVKARAPSVCIAAPVWTVTETPCGPLSSRHAFTSLKPSLPL